QTVRQLSKACCRTARQAGPTQPDAKQRSSQQNSDCSSVPWVESGRDQACYNGQGAKSPGERTEVQLMTDTDEALLASVVLLGRINPRQGPGMAMQLQIPIRPAGIDRCA